jgi:hypothetical protein
MSAIESLRSKQWMAGNLSNGEKYKRLHGEAAGLSEVKEKKIRLMHMPINGDFWYVCDILKKDGNNPKQHRIILNGLAYYCKIDVEAIREIGSISQKGINPDDVIVAYESGDPNTMNYLYQQAKRLVGLQELYKDLCFEYYKKIKDNSGNIEQSNNQRSV